MVQERDITKELIGPQQVKADHRPPHAGVVVVVFVERKIGQRRSLAGSEVRSRTTVRDRAVAPDAYRHMTDKFLGTEAFL